MRKSEFCKISHIRGITSTATIYSLCGWFIFVYIQLVWLTYIQMYIYMQLVWLTYIQMYIYMQLVWLIYIYIYIQLVWLTYIYLYTACVADWSMKNDTSSSAGSPMAGITTLVACQDACVAQLTCVAIDVDFASGSTLCWHHNMMANIAVTRNTPGIYQYILNSRCGGQSNAAGYYK